MFKKIMAVLSVLLVLTGLCFASGSSESETESVADVIAKAESMTLEELEAAAQAEFEAAGIPLTAKGPTSGLKKVLAAFQEKYPWFQYNEFSSSKDQALYTELTTGIGQGQYVADVVMVQDGSSLQSMIIDTGYMLNYVPNSVELAEGDKNPLTALYVNKNFIWNNFKAYCAEMEGASIAHVCYLNRIPFVIIRSISVIPDTECIPANMLSKAKSTAER